MSYGDMFPGEIPGRVLIRAWCKGCEHATTSRTCKECNKPFAACANCGRCPACDGPVVGKDE
jgi:hypothetical protein